MKPGVPAIRPLNKPSILPKWVQGLADDVVIRDMDGNPVSGEKREKILLAICNRIEAFVQGKKL